MAAWGVQLNNRGFSKYTQKICVLDLCRCRCSLRERQPLRKIVLNVPSIRHLQQDPPPSPNQIFLGGDPLLDLPGLLRYRISGDMEERLKKLEAAGGPVVLRLVEHMVQRDAGKRKTVKVRRGPYRTYTALQRLTRTTTHSPCILLAQRRDLPCLRC